jgi:hypothetical protein
MLRQMQMSSRLRLLIPAAGGLVVGLLFSYLLTCVRMSYLVFFAARFHQPACRLTQICREAGLVPNTAAAFDIELSSIILGQWLATGLCAGLC